MSEPLQRIAAAWRAAGIECTVLRRYQHRQPGRTAGYFTVDLTIVANNAPVALVRVVTDPPEPPSWYRVRAYRSLGLPCFRVPAAEAAAFAEAWKAANVRALNRWRVQGQVPAPREAPF
jgi:hypothetical protein